jgi:hypothetical protein
MLDIILEDLEFISDSIDLINSRFSKINKPSELKTTIEKIIKDFK